VQIGPVQWLGTNLVWADLPKPLWPFKFRRRGEKTAACCPHQLSIKSRCFGNLRNSRFGNWLRDINA
jgi:hypothetical protein